MSVISSETRNLPIGRFPFLFGLGVVAFEMLLAFLIWHNAPTGMKWLGDTMQNSSDMAVYMSYLRQGADGHVLLKNLYAIEPHALRFDLVWSLLGLVARTGLPILFIHEAARWIFTLVLACSVFLAARSVAKTDSEARLGTILAFGGVGMGWLYSIWLGVGNAWTAASYAAPDTVTEFAVAPTLMGGAHMILSLALLIAALVWSSRAIATGKIKPALFTSLSAAALLLFHPYALPLLSLFWGLCAIHKIVLHDRKLTRETVLICVILFASFLPAALVYVPLLFDPVFRTHHLVVNSLPLPPWRATLATILPFLGALAWRAARKIKIEEREYWVLFWLVSAVACLFLPFPWKRKLTEGFSVALVLLTLPAWNAIRIWIMSGRSRLTAQLTAGMLLLFAFLTPLHLFSSHLTWISDPVRQRWFYEPENLFDAFAFLHEHTPVMSVITSDDAWYNVWIPPYAGRVTWVAHDHETPDFATKRALWGELVSTDDPERARIIAANAGLTHLITTSDESTQRFRKLLGTAWIQVFHEGDITILEHTDPLRSVASR